MLKKHDAWHGAMVWPHHALVKIWYSLAYVVMHALHKSNHHRGSSMLSRGKSPKLKGNQNIPPSLAFSFFSNDQHTASIARCSNLTFSRANVQYLGDYVQFLGIIAHNSSSNNRCMKGRTRMAGKPCSCHLVNSHAFYKEGTDISMKCVAIVNHKHLFIGFSTIEKMK